MISLARSLGIDQGQPLRSLETTEGSEKNKLINVLRSLKSPAKQGSRCYSSGLMGSIWGQG